MNPSSHAEPVTPALSHADLPGKQAGPGATTGASSLTPPPSSQIDQHPKTRTPTPAASHLSSPPPTTEVQSSASKNPTTLGFSINKEQIQKASAEELRALVAELQSSVQEAKTTAAHYKLQYQMLSMESSEAAERMAVEMDMAQRELDVLQTSDKQLEQQSVAPQPEQDPSVRTVHVDLYNAMVHEIRELKSQNIYLDSANAHQKKLLLQQESEIASLNDRVLLMRDRIRESRDHLTKNRRPGGLMETTPRTEQSTPFQTPRRGRPTTQPNSQEQQGFAALLHATDLMSQGTASATPTPRYRKVSGQSRGNATVPSLPATPQRIQAKPAHQLYYTPQHPRQQQRQAPNTAPPGRKQPMFDPVRIASEAREQESDGTVSASDDSEAETEVPDQEDDVEESHASQRASDLLRSPTAGRGKARPAEAKRMVQSKLFGSVKKAGIEREDEVRGVKRPRVNSIGLGIDGVKD